MVQSMTAFAREEISAEWGAAAWELRSVNHRYLDVSLRLPEELRSLDAGARERIAAKVRRGKIDCSLRVQPAAGGGAGFSLDLDLAKRLLDAKRKVEAAGRRVPGGLPLRSPTALDVLRWPGVAEPQGIDRESVGGAALRLLDRALDTLVAARAREGAKLGDMVAGRCEEVGRIAARVRAALPDVQERYRARLVARLDEARVDIDPNRLAQELGDVREPHRRRRGAGPARHSRHGGPRRPRERVPDRGGASTFSCRSSSARPIPWGRSRPTPDTSRASVDPQGAHRADARAGPEHRVA